jgi:hypothetical protein
MNMREREREREERLQAEAEAAERQGLPPGRDAAVDEYRLVMRALRLEPVAGLPLGFAARVARRVMFAEERGSVEDWIVTGLMLAMAAGGLYYLYPVIARMMATVHLDLPTLPWPLLLAAGAAVAVSWCIEQGAARRHK